MLPRYSTLQHGGFVASPLIGRPQGEGRRGGVPSITKCGRPWIRPSLLLALDPGGMIFLERMYPRKKFSVRLTKQDMRTWDFDWCRESRGMHAGASHCYGLFRGTLRAVLALHDGKHAARSKQVSCGCPMVAHDPCAPPSRRKRGSLGFLCRVCVCRMCASPPVLQNSLPFCGDTQLPSPRCRGSHRLGRCAQAP